MPVPGCMHLTYRGSKNGKLTIFPTPMKFLAPETIPGVPWSYPENFEVIDAPVPKLPANKEQTYTYTQTELLYYRGILFFILFLVLTNGRLCIFKSSVGMLNNSAVSVTFIVLENYIYRLLKHV